MEIESEIKRLVAECVEQSIQINENKRKKKFIRDLLVQHMRSFQCLLDYQLSPQQITRLRAEFKEPQIWSGLAPFCVLNKRRSRHKITNDFFEHWITKASL